MPHDVEVHIIDDDLPMSRSIEQLLRLEGYAPRCYKSAEDFLAGITLFTHGVTICDVSMPEMTGLELLQELRRRRWVHPVIMLTGHADVGMAVEAMRAGASDFLEKPFVAEALLDAIRRSSEDIGGEPDLVRQRLAKLSKREREVLQYLIDGATNKSIAIGLGISPRTVEIYRSKLMDKMQAENLSKLVRMGVEVGLNV